MNHLLFGTLLLITLNAQECNQENSNGEISRNDQVEKPVIEEKAAPSAKDYESVMQDSSMVLGKKWYLISMNAAPLALPEGAERPWLEMQGGQLQGFGGCNNLMGRYLLQNDRLTFTEVGSTKKYCPDIQATERSILDMLAKVGSYKMNADSLQLLQGREVIASLKQAN